MSKYHFIGIKGSGMSSLAQIAYDMGHEVQGSDEETYFFTQEKLEQRNIPMLYYGAENIKEGYDTILGNAFDETHVEYRRAKELGLKTYTYSQFLGKLLGLFALDTIANLLKWSISNITFPSFIVDFISSSSPLSFMW